MLVKGCHAPFDLASEPDSAKQRFRLKDR